MRCSLNSLRNYLEVTKPKATLLLAFIAVASAVVAAGGPPFNPLTLVYVGLTVLVASAGANGLTNYLDRDIDARMPRTRHRALASKRIDPPEKALPFLVGLVLAGLALSWFITAQQAWHPAFIADVVGTAASLVWRKRATCVFPQGFLAGCAPVLIGWFAVNPHYNWHLALLCILIGLWLPLHVWSVMIAHREEYVRAKVVYFPINQDDGVVTRLLSGFVLALGVASVAIYFTGGFSLIYLFAAILLSGVMIIATFRLNRPEIPKNAWRLYKLSSFPYLGLLFLVMLIDVWF
jgi:heme o synthase